MIGYGRNGKSFIACNSFQFNPTYTAFRWHVLFFSSSCEIKLFRFQCVCSKILVGSLHIKQVKELNGHKSIALLLKCLSIFLCKWKVYYGNKLVICIETFLIISEIIKNYWAFFSRAGPHIGKYPEYKIKGKIRFPSVSEYADVEYVLVEHMSVQFMFPINSCFFLLFRIFFICFRCRHHNEMAKNGNCKIVGIYVKYGWTQRRNKIRFATCICIHSFAFFMKYWNAIPSEWNRSKWSVLQFGWNESAQCICYFFSGLSVLLVVLQCYRMKWLF